MILGLSKFLKKAVPAIPANTAGTPPPTLIISVNTEINAVPLSITPLKTSESKVTVDNSWNCALK